MPPELFLIEQKKQLESLIIGEVILENKYVLVGSILSPQNFSNYPDVDNRIIWQTIEKMHPCTPIDLITVRSNVYDWHGLNYSWLLTTYTNQVASTQHLRYHAILLLEIDIRAKLMSVLARLSEKAIKDEAFNKAVEIRQVQDHVKNKSIDLFDVIRTASYFLKGMGYNDEYEAIDSLVGYLPEKIIKVRRKSQIDSCISNLARISDIRPEYSSIIEKLTEAIHKVLKSDVLDHHTITQKIKELLNAI